MLAIQGLNHSKTNNDLLVLPELVGGSIDNTLTVENGNVRIGRDLILTQPERSQAELRMLGGTVEVIGNVQNDQGFSRIAMSDGRLIVRNRSDGDILLDRHSEAKYLIPKNGEGDHIWFDPNFDDTQWLSSPFAFGYDGSGKLHRMFATDFGRRDVWNPK